jgi:hypothetical protein
MSKIYYLFYIKLTDTIYCYTTKKDLARNYLELNKHVFDLKKISKSDIISNNIRLPENGKLKNYTLSDSDGNEYLIPMTEMEYDRVYSESVYIINKFNYIYHEIVPGNMYNLNKKYLNIIKGLTKELKSNKYELNENATLLVDSLQIYSNEFGI